MPRVLAVYETFDDRSMRAATDRTRDYTRTFNVIVDSRLISPDLILFATPGVPRRWEPYVSAAGTVDAYSICKDVEAKQDTGDPYTWRIKASYSNAVQRPDINVVENPLLRPAEIEWDSVAVTRPAWTDRDGFAIYNSSYERFDPPLEYEEDRLQLTITRNQLAYDALGYLKFKNAVNKKAWFGFAPGRVRCMGIKAKRAFEAGFFHWPTTYTFQIRVQLDEDEQNPNDPEASKNAWAYKVVDRGYMVLDDDSEPIHMRDRRTGQPLATPALLDGDGGRLPAGEEPVYLTIHLFPQRDFNALGLF